MRRAWQWIRSGLEWGGDVQFGWSLIPWMLKGFGLLAPLLFLVLGFPVWIFMLILFGCWCLGLAVLAAMRSGWKRVRRVAKAAPEIAEPQAVQPIPEHPLFKVDWKGNPYELTGYRLWNSFAAPHGDIVEVAVCMKIGVQNLTGADRAVTNAFVEITHEGAIVCVARALRRPVKTDPDEVHPKHFNWILPGSGIRLEWPLAQFDWRSSKGDEGVEPWNRPLDATLVLDSVGREHRERLGQLKSRSAPS